jgi:hypothetical protein
MIMLARIQYWLPVIEADLRTKALFVNHCDIRRIYMSPSRPIQGKAVAEVERHEADEPLITGLLPDFATGGLFEALARLQSSRHALPEVATSRGALQQQVFHCIRGWSAADVNKDLIGKPCHEHLLHMCPVVIIPV